MDGWKGSKDTFSFKSTHPKKETVVLQIKGGQEKADQVRDPSTFMDTVWLCLPVCTAIAVVDSVFGCKCGACMH
jgi:hypothetical protein